MRNIPVLYTQGKTLAETYEKGLINLYNNGTRFKTAYDKVNDTLSIDATMNLIIDEPLSDPMIHKFFQGGVSDLKEYTMELKGIKDDWVKNINDSKDTRWLYTYSGRFRHWGQWKELHMIDAPSISDNLIPNSVKCGFADIDQVEAVIQQLIKEPFTRRAQIIVWNPVLDLNSYDCPCLQSIWLRIVEENGAWWLNTNIRIRSNDSVGAFFYNIFGLVMFVKEAICDEIAKRTGKEVKMARLNWQADSWHIYGKDIKMLEEQLLSRLSNTKFEDRVYNFYDPDIQEMYNEAEQMVIDKVNTYNKEQLEKQELELSSRIK